MATKLTLRAELDYKYDNSNDTEKVELEFYNEKNDNFVWMLESFCTFLRGCGYPDELIKKYLNWDGEVFEIDDK